VESGHSVLCKIEHKSILEQINILEKTYSKSIRASKSPYGSGDAANKIAEIIEKKFF
jgi:UDP-N-acetylglucosamine 2-epimerase